VKMINVMKIAKLANFPTQLSKGSCETFVEQFY